MSAPPPTTSPLCQNCGACCKTFQVLVSKEDGQREPRIRDEALVIPAWLQTEQYHYKLHPLPFHERCCFLDQSNLCQIYASRPAVCRAFEPGSAECLAARQGAESLARNSNQ